MEFLFLLIHLFYLNADTYVEPSAFKLVLHYCALWGQLQVLCAGQELASEETLSRMINLLRQLLQTLPPSDLASTWSSLQPQHQLALQSILSS